MADLNALIAQGYQFQPPPDPFAQYGKMQQLQSAGMQNQLAQYQLGSAQRADVQANAMNQAYASAIDPITGAIDYGKVARSLATGGVGSQIPAVEKARLEQETANLTRQKLAGDVAAQPVKLSADKAKLLEDKLKLSRQFLDTLDPSDPNAPARYLAWHEANHADPDIGPALAARGVTTAQARAQIDAAIANGPQAFAQMLNQSKLGTEKFIEMNKPTTQVIDQSGQRQVIQIPGLGGAPVNIGTYADVPLPPAVEAQKARTAKAGATNVQTNVNAFTPASEEAQRDFIKSTRATYDTLKSAPGTLKNIEEAKRLIPGAKGFMGPGGESLLDAASFLNNRLGTNIETKGITDATVLRSRLFQGIIENLRKLDANPTENQQNAMRVALGNIGTDPNALPAVLDSFADTVRSKVEMHNAEVGGAVARGVKFPYDPTVKLPSFTPPLPSGASLIPGSTPAAGGGATVTLPDGRIKTFPNAAAANQFKKAAGL